MKRIMLALLVLLCFSATAEARWRWRRSYYPTVSAVNVDYSGCETDQEMCQREAEAMAASCVAGNCHLGVNLGAFEGVGCGYTPDCGTCEPATAMTCTGDAVCQASNGLWYRVRCWR